jgi:hypothetical protein
MHGIFTIDLKTLEFQDCDVFRIHAVDATTLFTATKIGYYFFVKIFPRHSRRKTVTLKIKFCLMQFKFSIRYEKIIEK